MDLNHLIAANTPPLPQVSGFNKGFFKTASNPSTRTADIISNIITVFTIFGGLAFLFWFVIGAFQWASSGGNPQQLDKAKSQMSTAIAGLFVLILSSAFFFIIGKVTGFEILNLEKIVQQLLP